MKTLLFLISCPVILPLFACAAGAQTSAPGARYSGHPSRNEPDGGTPGEPTPWSKPVLRVSWSMPVVEHWWFEIDEHISDNGFRVVARDIQEGIVYERSGVTISAFIVDHGPAKPALGYRIDYAEHSIAFSVDTRPSDNLVKHCQGVDVLIHQVTDDEALCKLAVSEQLLKAIVGHHTTPEQAGQIFDRVRPNPGPTVGDCM